MSTRVKKLKRSSESDGEKSIFLEIKHSGKCFCEVTSIHGVHYLVESDRPVYERVWWFLVLVISIGLASKYAGEVWRKWTSTPIQDMTVDTLRTVTEIPFPAVTVCSNMKSKYKTGLSEDEGFLYLCGEQSDENINLFTNESINIDYLINMAPIFKNNCTFSLQEKGYLMSEFNCHIKFNKILTDQGVCYTYNMLDKTEIFRKNVIIHFDSKMKGSTWRLDAGYATKITPPDRSNSFQVFQSSYPKRMISMSATTFQFSLNHSWGNQSRFRGQFRNQRDPYCLQSSTPGFKVMLHSPMEVPMVGHRRNLWTPFMEDKIVTGRYLDVPMNHEMLIMLDPTVVWTGNSLEPFHPKLRRCYFPNEKELVFFKVYTQNNCLMECLTNVTLGTCKCVDFYMPRFKDMQICAGTQLLCVLTAFEDWQRSQEHCRCYPTCTNIYYKPKVFFKTSLKYGMNENTSYVRMLVSDDDYVNSERRAVFGLVDFIANCGGIFGLFCGMSLVSLIELLYFATLRTLSDIFRVSRLIREKGESILYSN